MKKILLCGAIATLLIACGGNAESSAELDGGDASALDTRSGIAETYTGDVVLLPFDPCFFPPVQAEMCLIQPGDSEAEKESKSASNCALTYKTNCPGDFCLSYHGSAGFCSMTCTTDEDCLQGACKEFAFSCSEGEAPCQLCVKEEFL